MHKNITTLPKVGIRPFVSLNNSVNKHYMDSLITLCNEVSEFISNSIKHPSGDQIECVMPDTPIITQEDGLAWIDKCDKENVQISFTITSNDCFGLNAIDVFDIIPKAVWCFDQSLNLEDFTTKYSDIYENLDFPVFNIYSKNVKAGYYFNDEIKSKVIRFIKCAMAVVTMRNKTYLNLGSSLTKHVITNPNIDFFKHYLDIRTEHFEIQEISRRIKNNIYDVDEFKKAYDWVKANCNMKIPAHLNSPEYDIDKDLEYLVKMTIVAKDMIKGNEKLNDMGFTVESKGYNAIISNFRGDHRWSYYLTSGNFLETILNSSFDWNGPRAPHIIASENDSLNGAAMLFGYLVTGTAQTFADMRMTLSSRTIKRKTGYQLENDTDGLILLVSEGSSSFDVSGSQKDDNNNSLVKPFWELNYEDIKSCLRNTSFIYSQDIKYRGGGFTTTFRTSGNMPVTLSSITLKKGIGPVLHIVEGYTVELPDEVHKKIIKSSSNNISATWFRLNTNTNNTFKSIKSLFKSWNTNNAALSYGHIGSDLVTLASMLRIPVTIDNIDNDEILRPSNWFLDHKHKSDFLACMKYGPIYKDL